jgi:hypothetical protein
MFKFICNIFNRKFVNESCSHWLLSLEFANFTKLWVRIITNKSKILVNTSTFVQFLLHIFMWCHFNGMLIMESCAYSLIWILINLKCVKKSSTINFWLKQRMFNSYIQWYYFHKGHLSFCNTIFLMLNFFVVIGYY